MTDVSRRLLVFGGTGFLGGQICIDALDRFDVHATRFSAPERPTDGVTWHRCDLTKAAAVGTLIRQVQPTHVINVAYRQSGENAYEVCALGPETIARATAAIDARFVHFSTDLVFGGDLGRPHHETDEVSPLGEYGNAKAESELRVMSANPEALIVRTSLIYGADDAPQEQLVARAIRDGDIQFFTDEWRSPVHVSDLSQTTLDMASSDWSGIVHLAGAERVNRLEFAQLLATHAASTQRHSSGELRTQRLVPEPKM